MKKYSETSKKVGVKNSSIENAIKRGRRQTCLDTTDESVGLKAYVGVRTYFLCPTFYSLCDFIFTNFFPICDSTAQNVKLFTKKV